MSARSKGSKKAVAKKPFDKYNYYRRAVQSPEGDVEFFRDTYREIRGRAPTILREDFCGTFALCCEWAKLSPTNIAYGCDLDPEPIAYGRANYLSKLKPSQQSRVHIDERNVLDPKLPKSDVICAMNFSYYIFKKREQLRAYFANCFATLKPDGILIADSFGGALCQSANEEDSKRRGFTYYWDQASFDPITHDALFHIHFKPNGQKKIEKVFTYDWRMWTLPEIKEIMLEAGFKTADVYWEGSTRSGEGNGVFKKALKGEDCNAWIAYVIGQK